MSTTATATTTATTTITTITTWKYAPLSSSAASAELIKKQHVI